MRRRRRRYSGVWLAIVLGLIIAIGALFFLKIYSVKNSEEFDLTKESQYLFINKDKNEAYYVIIDGNRRAINVIKMKNNSYDSKNKIEIDFASPILSLENLSKLFDVKADFSYYVYANSQQISEFAKKLNVNESGLEEIFNVFVNRGLKLFDYFKLDSALKELRPEITLTKPALAKLLYAFGNFSVRFRTMPTVTEKPLEITVGNKTFERIYIDLEKLEQIKNEIGG